MFESTSKFRKYFTIFVFLFILFFVIAAFIGKRNDDSESSLSILQNHLTELIAMKIQSDSFVGSGGDNVQSEQEIQDTFRNNAQNLAAVLITSILEDYKIASLVWAKRVFDTEKIAEWKTLSYLPGDFRISASDYMASRFLASSVSKIAALKEEGDLAVKNEDIKAMQKVSASLLVQIHWLNGILHSTGNIFASIGINKAYAATNLLKLPDIPEVGKGCPIETDSENQNYGKCKIPGVLQNTTETNKPKIEKKLEERKVLVPQDQLIDDANFFGYKIEKYEPYTYSSNMRKVCFQAYGGKDVCGPEVIEATTDIYEASVNYSNNVTEKSVLAWNKAWETAKDTASIDPSMPSVVGGHEIPSEGVVSKGEEDVVPPPTPVASKQAVDKSIVPSVPRNVIHSWDGIYQTPNFRWTSISCTGYTNPGYTNPTQYHDLGGFKMLVVKNNVINATSENLKIDSNGFASREYHMDEYSYTDSYQFYKMNNKNYVDGKSIERYVEKYYDENNVTPTICTRTAKATSSY